MAHPKFIAIYNGMPLPFDDIADFAKRVMGLKVVKNYRGTWDVVVNGEEVAHYTDEWTKEEVERDYLNGGFFKKWTRKNLAFYRLVGSE